MKKLIKALLFLLAILLCGALGFAAAGDLKPAGSLLSEIALLGALEPSAIAVDVDLSAESDEKTHETEPEEIPSAGDIEVEIIPHTREEGKPLRVLIYHTHTYEAYEPKEKGEYQETERWRTAEPEYNMVRVGAELARVLRDEYGMAVVHDDTPFEPPKLSTAYQRSLEAIENYMARGETFDLYLDIHRDAYSGSDIEKNTVTIDGEKTARVMFLIGTGEGEHMGQAFAQKPNWEENKLRAERMTAALEREAEGICRKVSTKSSRYNQHVSMGALLIEVGNNMNSLDEALAAIPHLARAIAETAGGTQDAAFVSAGSDIQE